MNALQDKLFSPEGSKADSCGLRIVGFPCNQFGLQEPAANKYELLNGLKYVRPGHGFVPNFQLLEKRDVNGEKEDEIYTYFKVRLRVSRSKIKVETTLNICRIYLKKNSC